MLIDEILTPACHRCPYLLAVNYFLVLVPVRHKRRYKSHRVSNRCAFNELTEEVMESKTMLHDL